MMKNSIVIFCLVLLLSPLFNQCKKSDSTLSDAEQTAALRNVSFTYKEMSNDVSFPSGALTSGKSFKDLVKEDSAKYANPANYGIKFGATTLADNTKSGASDAKFDGMVLNILFDTIKTPVKTEAGAFTILKNTTAPIVAEGTINLKTHRLVGLYIFKQMVDGNDLSTTFAPTLNYKIGLLTGSFDALKFKQNIPTRASDETKAFLKGLLDSGMFNKVQ